MYGRAYGTRNTRSACVAESGGANAVPPLRLTIPVSQTNPVTHTRLTISRSKFRSISPPSSPPSRDLRQPTTANMPTSPNHVNPRNAWRTRTASSARSTETEATESGSEADGQNRSVHVHRDLGVGQRLGDRLTLGREPIEHVDGDGPLAPGRHDDDTGIASRLGGRVVTVRIGQVEHGVVHLVAEASGRHQRVLLLDRLARRGVGDERRDRDVVGTQAVLASGVDLQRDLHCARPRCRREHSR